MRTVGGDRYVLGGAAQSSIWVVRWLNRCKEKGEGRSDIAPT